MSAKGYELVQSVVWDADVADQMATLLVEHDCVGLRSFSEPATWWRLASGSKSPFIVWVRRMILHPVAASRSANWLAALVAARFPRVELIAACATAGITWGTRVAERTGVASCTVRREPKGRNVGDGRVDPAVERPERQALIVDDLVNSGLAAAAAIEAVEAETRAEVVGVVWIVSWAQREALDRLGHPERRHLALTSWPQILTAAVRNGLMPPDAARTLETYFGNPETFPGWS